MQLFVERVTVMDFSYLHADRGMVGESWQVDLELEGELDDQGMILDFGDIKRQFKSLIDEEFDHRLLVPGKDPGLQHLTTSAEDAIHFPLTDGTWIHHIGPPAALTVIPAIEITPEQVSVAIIDRLQSLLPINVSRINVNLVNEDPGPAYYHYSHGLKLHCGNCQRIAHGHRSRLLIYRNDVRDTELERDWVARWRDIYIGTREDLVEVQADNYRFAYQAEQGRFELTIPRNRCWLIDTESTVENIARYIADSLSRENPHCEIRVRAYEGIGKGAVGLARTD